MQDEIVDRIYEAAFIPERWKSVLEGGCEIADAVSASLLIFPENAPPRYIATELTEAGLKQFVESGAWRYSEHIPQKHKIVYPAEFFHFQDVGVYDRGEPDAVDAALASLGLDAQITTVLDMPTNEVVSITLERRIGEGRFQRSRIEAMNAIRPHLARAGMVAGRLMLDRAFTAVATLESLGLPAAVLSSDGRILAANRLLEELRGAVVFRAMGRFAVSHDAANRMLADALQMADLSLVTRSIPLPPIADHPAMILHLVPARGAARDIFWAGASILIVTPVRLPNAPDAAILNGLFDLTPAEARLVRRLLAGETIGDAANAMDLSVTTLRSQLSSIFSKTGTTRQPELLTLIASIALPR